MNPDFPPLVLPQPQFLQRRPESPRRPPIPPELLVRRAEIARVLGVEVASLSKSLKKMTGDERRAMFYKIEHDQPVSLTGTGLKNLTQPSRNVTLAIPKSEDLEPFNKKLRQFGEGALKKGHAPHESFAYITGIKLGEPKDRLSDGLAANYDGLCQADWVVCELELLTLILGKNKQREDLEQALAELETAFSQGIHGVLFEHEITRGVCRAVVRVTGKMFQTLVEERAWQQRISWFEEKPSFQTFHQVWKDFTIAKLGPMVSPEDDAPTVCVIDTGITAGNPFLAPVVKEDLLKSFLENAIDNPYDDYGHGSGVASLTAYFALNLDKGATNTGKVWIAGARVLNENNEIEEKRLFSKLLEEVVEHFVPLGVRIFLLAVGNPVMTWNIDTKRTVPRNSWVARKIDALSREHDVVFVTCTGNLSIQDIQELRRSGQDYPDYLAAEESRILDPGQAALALTVGSVAPRSPVVGKGVTAIAPPDSPSPFTRRGPGIERETKPEVVEYGGNLVHDTSGDWVRSNLGTNVVMASHQRSPAVTHSQGTSYAAPRAAHKLALVLKDLQDLGVNSVSAELLKAIFVNSAAYRINDEGLADLEKSLASAGSKPWLQVFGHGMADAANATFCDDYSTTLYFQGEIKPNTVAYFDVPILDELRKSTSTKQLTVTVVHSPEVQRWGLERYLGTDLKWWMFRGDTSQEDVIQAMSSDEETGSEEEEIELPNELKFEYGVNRRSRGVIQRDNFSWKHHREGYSENHYTLAVAAYERWGRKNPDDVPFAVVLRIEDVGRQAKIYSATVRALAEIEVKTQSRSMG